MSTLTSLVGGRRWAARVAILAGILALIATTLAVVPALGTNGTHPDISDLPNEGVLTLHLGADPDQFEFREWDPATTDYVATTPAPSIQQIGPPVRCELSSIDTDDAGDLATVASLDSHSVGLVDDNVGLRARGSRGTPCGQVDISEGVLSFALADNGPLAGMEIDYAEIDIEGKHDVAIDAQAYLDGIAVGIPIRVVDCEIDADCGPDSADEDNFRVVFAVSGHAGSDVPVDAFEVDSVFDRIDFVVASTDSGDFSLAGGADGTEPGPLGDFLHVGDSIFHITNVITLSCDGDTPFGDQSDGGLGGTVFLGNCDDDKAVTFAADVVGNSVTINNVGTADPETYTLEFWTFLPAPTIANLFYNDGTDDDRQAEFCLSDPRDTTTTVPDGITLSDVLPGTHTTCIVQETRATVGAAGGPAVLRGDFILFSTGDASRAFR